MNKNRGAEWVDMDKRRRYANSRYNEVSKKSVVYFILLNEKSIKEYCLETRTPDGNNSKIQKIKESFDQEVS
jgi:hypothetical protein